MADTGSVTVWLGQLLQGDPDAADRLWERYFRRLQGLARVKLPTELKNNAHAEDIALDAFASLWRGTQKGQFPQLASRDQLWRLLVVITARKAYRLARTEARELASQAREWELEQVLASEPGPGFEVQAAEECQRLMALLGDPRLEAVAQWRLEGLTVPEIAARLRCSPRTVDRKLALIQTLWSEEIEP
jgi:DNA-directed RNA polymerase specialized sigma24 family protein